MTVRSDIAINWNTSPRIITVAAPSTSIFLQDLLDTCREAEDDLQNMVYGQIVNAAGKENLGGGLRVGITLILINALLAFEARSGPDFVKCSVLGGNLVAIDSGGGDTDPIANTNYTQVTVTLSSSAALISGTGGLTSSDVKEAVKPIILPLYSLL